MPNPLRAAFPSNDVLRLDTIKRAAERSSLYVIFFTPRSGSSWLTELVMNTGRIGTPQEWFNPDFANGDAPSLGCLPPRARGIADINDYVDAIVNEGNGAAGLEIDFVRAGMLRELIDGPLDTRCFKAFFYLRRQDVIAQAVSLYRSVESGRFHSYQNDPRLMRDFANVEYNAESIISWLRFLIDGENTFRDCFRALRINPVRLFYEDILQDPLSTLVQIADHIGAERPQSSPTFSLSILRDQKNLDWRDRIQRALPADIADWIERERASLGA